MEDWCFDCFEPARVPRANFADFSFQRSQWPEKPASLIEKETMFHSRGKLKNEHRTSNVQHRIMYSVNLKKLSNANLLFEIRFRCFRQAQALSLPRGASRL